MLLTKTVCFPILYLLTVENVIIIVLVVSFRETAGGELTTQVVGLKDVVGVVACGWGRVTVMVSGKGFPLTSASRVTGSPSVTLTESRGSEI